MSKLRAFAADVADCGPANSGDQRSMGGVPIDPAQLQ